MHDELPRPFPDALVELIATRMRVLGQPMRVRIVEHLERSGEITVQALADELGGSQQNVSRHLGLLAQAGVLSQRREGRMVWYRLADRDAYHVVHRVGVGVLGRLRELRGE